MKSFQTQYKSKIQLGIKLDTVLYKSIIISSANAFTTHSLRCHKISPILEKETNYWNIKASLKSCLFFIFVSIFLIAKKNQHFTRRHLVDKLRFYKIDEISGRLWIISLFALFLSFSYNGVCNSLIFDYVYSSM